MTPRKVLILVCLITCLASTAWSQQQILNTQYVFNRHLIHPGFTGIGGRLQASLLVRNQWRGVNGAPTTQALSIHAPINDDKTFSLGGIVIRDKIGVTTQTGVYMTAAYQLQVNEDTYVSFGLQGGFLNDQSNFSELPGFVGDPIFVSENLSTFRPNFGVGIYLVNKQFHFGLSVPNLVEQKFDQFTFQEGADIQRFFYIDTGYGFTIREDLVLEVSTLFKMQSGSPLQFDINGVLGYRSFIWLGTSYRSFESFDFLFRIKLGRDYYFGYSHDIATGPVTLSWVDTGSHEFHLQFGMSELTRKINRKKRFRR